MAHGLQGLVDFDSFASIDEERVVGLIKMAIEKARATQPETKVISARYYYNTITVKYFIASSDAVNFRHLVYSTGWLGDKRSFQAVELSRLFGLERTTRSC